MKSLRPSILTATLCLSAMWGCLSSTPASAMTVAPFASTVATPKLALRVAQEPTGASSSLAALPVHIALDVPSMPPGADVPAVTEKSSTAELEATAMYRLGLFKMTQGDFAGARQLFEQVKATYPETEAGKAAVLRIEQLSTLSAPAPVVPSAPAVAPAPNPPASAQGSTTPAASAKVVAGSADDPTNSGRAEFVVSQTLAGGAFGFMLPVAITEGTYRDTQDAQIVLGLIGLGGGLAGSLLFSTQDPISSAEALSWWTTQSLVSLNAFCLWQAITDSNQNLTKVSLGGLALGTVGGYFVSHYAGLSEGQASAALTAAMWAPILLNLGADAALTYGLDGRQRLYLIPLAADVAAVVAGRWLVAQNIPISRSRVRLISLGGFVGGAVGAAIYVLSDSSSYRTMAGLLSGGAVVGLGAGFYATRSWDSTYHPELFARRSSALVAYEDGGIKLGNFMPSLGFEEVEQAIGDMKVKRVQPMLQITLANGEF